MLCCCASHDTNPLLQIRHVSNVIVSLLNRPEETERWFEDQVDIELFKDSI
jgi:hypothetical protein